MTALEIRELCIEQAKSYLGYIREFSENNGKVCEAIRSIRTLEDGQTFEIGLVKKLFDIERCYFHDQKNNREYYFDKNIKTKEYDEDTKLLYIVVLDNDHTFSEIDFDQLVIVSDLTFLIKNVIEWFEHQGHKLHLSEKVSTLCSHDLSMSKIVCNEEQKQALQTLFNSAQSYVWGPPGTGKTRVVLSTSAINYIKNDKRILIIAPTNVALEQIMEGLLPILDDLDINRYKTLRLGTPSKKFAMKYPEVCEVRGIEKQLQSLQNQIRIFKKITRYRIGIKVVSELEPLSKLIDEMQNLYEHNIFLDEKLKNISSLWKIVTQPLKQYHFQENARLLREAISKHKASPCVKYDEAKIQAGLLKEVINEFCVSEEMERIRSKIYTNRKIAEDYFQEFSQGTSSNPVNDEILNGISLDTISLAKERIINKKIQILQWIDEEEAKLKPDIVEIAKQSKFDEYVIAKALSKHYDKRTDEDLALLLQNLESEYTTLFTCSLEGRMAGSNVIAMTLDNYIMKTMRETLPIDHIFLDEAGYASLIKTLTLFIHDIPITLLGDHKQLPPVYEIRKEHPKSIKNTFLWGMSGIFFEEAFIDSRENLWNIYETNSRPTYQKLNHCILKATHRFGKTLADVLNKHIYHYGFYSALNEETLIYHIDSESLPALAEDRHSIEEVKCIKELLPTKVVDKNFAILTPYRKQLNLIRQNIDRTFYDSVMTVHQSQGNEWDTVIFSIVDDAQSGKRGYYFTNSLSLETQGSNLINTVVSRAKKRLILVGNKSFWLKQEGQILCDLFKISNSLTIGE